VVEVFAKSLTKQGRKVAILSRGYRSNNHNGQPVRRESAHRLPGSWLPWPGW
jgi:tetraacyldisaccharide-1-P 4'-kinase